MDPDQGGSKTMDPTDPDPNPQHCFKTGETHFTIEAVAEGEPVVDLSEQVAHVPRVLGLHFTFEPVHLVHVFAEKIK
jgi:hypothetical protein